MQINGKEYDLIISGADIIAEGLHDNIIYNEGAEILNAEAWDSYKSMTSSMDYDQYTLFRKDTSAAKWISDYEKEHVEDWVKRNKHLGTIVNKNLN